MIRFHILVGVSSAAAVEEKDSIPDQIRTCRAAIQHHGGVEVGLSIFDGYSRTGYENLSDALREIPAIAEAVSAAEALTPAVEFVSAFCTVGIAFL